METGRLMVYIGAAGGFLGLLGAVFALYFNFKKIAESIEKKSSEKTKADINVETITHNIEKMMDMLEKFGAKQTELLEYKLQQQLSDEALRKEIATVWRRIDEHYEAINRLMQSVISCKTCRDAPDAVTERDILPKRGGHI